MSNNKEKLGDKAKENIAKETREAIKPVIKKLVEKFDGLSFDKSDFGGAIKKGLDDAKADV